MKIKRLYIQAFGKHEDLELTPADGLTVIYGHNESGKTTVIRFILAMLYGFVKGLQRSDIEKNDRMRYLPWHSPGKYGGLLEIEHGGRRYQIVRQFGKRPSEDSLQVVDLESGNDVTLTGNEQPGERLLGMSREEFLSTVFIEQMGSPLETGKGANAELSRRLMRLASGGSDAAPRDVRERLEKERKALQPLRGDNGRIPRLEARYEALEDEWNEALAMAEQRARTEQALSEARREEAALETRRDALRRDEIRAERRRHIARYQKVRDLRQAMDARTAAIREDRERLAIPGDAPLPEGREVAAAYTTAADLPRIGETLRTQRREAQTLTRRLAAYPSEEELADAVDTAAREEAAVGDYRAARADLDRALQADRRAYEEKREAEERERRDATIARQQRAAEETEGFAKRRAEIRRKTEALEQAVNEQRAAREDRARRLNEADMKLSARTEAREAAEAQEALEQTRLKEQQEAYRAREAAIRDQGEELRAAEREHEEAEARRETEKAAIYRDVAEAEAHLAAVRAQADDVAATDTESPADDTAPDGPFTGRPAAHWTLVVGVLILILLMVLLPGVWPRLIAAVAVVAVTALLYRRFSRYEGNLEAQSGEAGKLSRQERREWDAYRALEEAERQAETRWHEAAEPHEAAIQALTAKIDTLASSLRGMEAGLPDLEARLNEQTEREHEAKKRGDVAREDEAAAREAKARLTAALNAARDADRERETAHTAAETKIREMTEKLIADEEAARKRLDRETDEDKQRAARLEAMHYAVPEALQARDAALTETKDMLRERLASRLSAWQRLSVDPEAENAAGDTAALTSDTHMDADAGQPGTSDHDGAVDQPESPGPETAGDDAPEISDAMVDEAAIRRRREILTDRLHQVRDLLKDRERVTRAIAETETEQAALLEAWETHLRGMPARILEALEKEQAPSAAETRETSGESSTDRAYTDAVARYEDVLDRLRETERRQDTDHRRLQELLGDTTEGELKQAAEAAQAAQHAEAAEATKAAQQADADGAAEETDGGPSHEALNDEADEPASPSDADLDPDSLRTRREELTAQMDEVKQKIGTLGHRLQSEMDAARVPQAIEEDLDACREELRAARELLAHYDLAIELVDAGIKRMRETFGPTIDKAASDYLTILTGEEQDLMVKGDFSMRLRDPVSGAFKDYHYFSGGKIDQTYLALRLAVIDTVYEKDGAALPRFIDDPFMQYDRERGRAAMTLMQHLADDGKQVIFTTCHAYYRDLAEAEGEKICEL